MTVIGGGIGGRSFERLGGVTPQYSAYVVDSSVNIIWGVDFGSNCCTSSFKSSPLDSRILRGFETLVARFRHIHTDSFSVPVDLIYQSNKRFQCVLERSRPNAPPEDVYAGKIMELSIETLPVRRIIDISRVIGDKPRSLRSRG